MEIADINYLFFYGKSDLVKETEHDLMLLLLQPKRRLFYNRSEGAGVAEYENYPNALALQIGLRYDISMAIANRNRNTTNGTGGTIDRRIASSQFAIQFDQDFDGNLDITVNYFIYSDLQTPQNIRIPVGSV